MTGNKGEELHAVGWQWWSVARCGGGQFGDDQAEVIDYIWKEIKGISLNPQNNCGFAPYLMFLVEDVTGRSFPKEGIHMPFRPNPTKKPLIPPPQTSSPPRADPAPQQQHEAVELVRPIGYTGQTSLGDQG
jgi:hypothetical protein